MLFVGCTIVGSLLSYVLRADAEESSEDGRMSMASSQRIVTQFSHEITLEKYVQWKKLVERVHRQLTEHYYYKREEEGRSKNDNVLKSQVIIHYFSTGRMGQFSHKSFDTRGRAIVISPVTMFPMDEEIEKKMVKMTLAHEMGHLAHHHHDIGQKSMSEEQWQEIEHGERWFEWAYFFGKRYGGKNLLTHIE